MDLSIIENYLQRYGWTHQKPEEGYLAVGFVSDEGNVVFLIVIQMVEPWLRFSIPAYLPIPEQNPKDFLLKALALNHEGRWAHFTVDSSGQLNLCLDLYCGDTLAYEQFELALDTLSLVAEMSFKPLLAAIEV